MNRLDAMQPSEIREIHNAYRALEAASPGREFIPLHFGEPDLGTPPFIVEAGCKALRDGVVFYENNSGRPDLKEALAAFYGLSPDHFVVTCGGMQALCLTALALLSPGDSIVNLTPCWPNITETARLAGARVHEFPLSFESTTHRFYLDFDRLRQAMASIPGLRMLIVNSPSNPTGWVIRSQEREQLDALCRERDLVVLSDEIYNRILFTDEPFPSALQDPDFSRLVVVNGFSKTYCMTGWRIGYLVTDPARAAAMAQLQEFIVSHAPGAGQVAGITALRDGEEFVRESLMRYRGLRDLVADRLGAIPGAQAARADGAFYTFFRHPKSADSVDFCRRLLHETGVVLAPGRAFGAAGEGWLRLCFANQPDRLRAAIQKLEAFLG